MGSTYVVQSAESNYMVLNSAYAGLTGFASTYTIVSDACELTNLQSVTAGVMEQIQLTRIPIFQFAMYSSGEMEVSCGQPFTVNGPVHSNGQLYVEPDSVLTFQSGVTAVGTVQFGRDPLDTRAAPSGSVTYDVTPKSAQPALTLPIGTTNTPTAVREIIEPPPGGESPTSPIGRLRYFNQADMLVTVSNASIRVTSGSFNGFSTNLTTNEVNAFLSTNGSFYDWREHKTVCPINLNIAGLTNWDATNRSLRLALNRSVESIYLWDARTLPAADLGAVRVSNGITLTPLGLTIATHDPLYIQGHYNQPVSTNLGTANVTTTLPASLVADAITILSTAWTDANSTASLTSRNAASTTVNAAILAGEVDTTYGYYSGGMENFPRFLESWGSTHIFTYWVMVKMFPSFYATNVWGQTNVYNPPARNWTYDTNFNIPTALPPLTPSLQVVFRVPGPPSPRIRPALPDRATCPPGACQPRRCFWWQEVFPPVKAVAACPSICPSPGCFDRVRHGNGVSTNDRPSRHYSVPDPAHDGPLYARQDAGNRAGKYRALPFAHRAAAGRLCQPRQLSGHWCRRCRRQRDLFRISGFSGGECDLFRPENDGGVSGCDGVDWPRAKICAAITGIPGGHAAGPGAFHIAAG